MKKIAVYHNLPIGGAKRVIYQQIKALHKVGYKIDLYEMTGTDETFLSLIPFTKRRFTYKYDIDIRARGARERICKDLKTFIGLSNIHRAIASDIDKKKYDFVLVHPDKYTQAPFLLKYLKTKNIYYCEEILRVAYEDIFKFREQVSIYKKWYEQITRTIRKRIDRNNATAASYIFANSEFTKQTIKNAYHKEARVVYPGIDATLFKPLSLKKEFDILYIGEREEYEGYYLLHDALKNIPKDITIYNPKRNGEPFNFSDKEVVEMYNKSKIVVALNYDEPFGYVPLEAMACGVPIIAVEEGGFKETVKNGETGYLIKRNQGKLAEVIKKVLSNSKLAKSLGQNGRRHVEKEWVEKVKMKQFLSVIDTI